MASKKIQAAVAEVLAPPNSEKRVSFEGKFYVRLTKLENQNAFFQYYQAQTLEDFSGNVSKAFGKLANDVSPENCLNYLETLENPEAAKMLQNAKLHTALINLFAQKYIEKGGNEALLSPLALRCLMAGQVRAVVDSNPLGVAEWEAIESMYHEHERRRDFFLYRYEGIVRKFTHLAEKLHGELGEFVEHPQLGGKLPKLTGDDLYGKLRQMIDWADDRVKLKPGFSVQAIKRAAFGCNAEDWKKMATFQDDLSYLESEIRQFSATQGLDPRREVRMKSFADEEKQIQGHIAAYEGKFGATMRSQRIKEKLEAERLK